MVLILVLMTLALSITVEVIRTRRHRRIEQARLSSVVASGAARANPRLLHPGNSWAKVIDRGLAVVGITDLAQSFIGRVERAEVPPVGKKVRQGEPLVTLRSGRRAISVVAPLSGKLRSVNGRVKARPSIVNESPYDDGWIAQVAPDNLEVESRNLVGGALAERWKESLLVEIRKFMSPELGTVLQDGGRWIDSLGDMLGDEAWESLAQVLFPLHSSGQSQTKPSQGTKP
jgi:glycine cleavage system H protein